VLGATLVGIAFVAPSFLMVLVLSALYLKFGGLVLMQALSYGIGAAVIAIIAWSATRLARTTLGRDRLLWGIFAVSLAVTAWTAREIIWLFVASGFIPLLARTRARPSLPSKALLVAPWPAWLTSGLTGAVSVGVLWKVFWYFAAAGLFVFGSGLARCPCVDEAGARTRAYRGVRRRGLAPEACVVGAAIITKRRSSSMKKLLKATLFLSLVAVGASPVCAQQPSTAAWDSVGRILGTAPTSAAGYIRYNLPRRDLTVRI